MNSPVKRRATPRRKNARSGSASQKNAGPSWLNEACAIVLFGVSLLLLLSIFSYALESPAIGSRSNLLGPIGHLFASAMFGAFGWTSVLAAGYLAYLARQVWGSELTKIKERVRKLRSQLVSRIIGLCAAMALASATIATFFGRIGGGALGNGIARLLISNINPIGSAILCCALLVVALALATGNSVQTLMIEFWYGVVGTARFFAISIPLGIWHGIQFVNRMLAATLSRILGARLWSKISALFVAPEMEPAAIIMPKPRIRKNEVPRDDNSREDEGVKASEETEYSNVVVMRRTGAPEKIDKKKIAVIAQPPAFTDINDAFPNYQAPDLSLLIKGEVTSGGEDDEELRQKSKQIEVKLKDFGIFGRVTQVHPGPVITLFEFEPAPGVKVGRIAALQDDLAMSLKASSIRIIAPIPKRGTVGIEVPNRNRDTVRLRDVFESRAFIDAESILSVGVGKDTYGDPVVVDIAQMPHLLMAGATGTGKSVCINALLLSLLYRAHPSELGLILIDPKILELSTYEDVPHLRVPVVTVPRQARAVLEWATVEMDRRYRLMQKYGVRNIDGYNQIARGEDLSDSHEPSSGRVNAGIPEPLEDPLAAADAPALDLDDSQPIAVSDTQPIAAEVLRPLPKIVIVIDELADLMLTVGREVEELITRLAQKARASGIHLILATQRPSVDVITGLIKANFPARLSFRVSSRIDSRTILDSMGAERLLGRGDMLFMVPGADAIRRVHGAFVSDSEVKRAVEAIKKTAKPCYDERIMQLCQKALEEKPEGESGEGAEEYDEVYDRAVELVVQRGQASTSMLQRAFRLGYNRAARIIEIMEREGVVGPMDGAKPREVLLNSGDDSL